MNEEKKVSALSRIKSAVLAIVLLPGGLFLSMIAFAGVMEKSYGLAVPLLAIGVLLAFIGGRELGKLIKAGKKTKKPAPSKSAQEIPAESPAKTHGNMSFKIAGVTFDNEDGKSRQTLLKRAYIDDCAGELEFEEYKFKGKQAVKILYNGNVLGNVPADRVREFVEIKDRITYADLDIDKFVPDDDDDECDDEDGKSRSRDEVYYGNVFVKYKIALD